MCCLDYKIKSTFKNPLFELWLTKKKTNTKITRKTVLQLKLLDLPILTGCDGHILSVRRRDQLLSDTPIPKRDVKIYLSNTIVE